MGTENGRISLLWKNGAVRPMRESDAACASLGLDSLIDLRSSRLSDHLTSDVPTLEYRAAVIRDAVSNPEAVKILRRIAPVMADMTDLRRLGSEAEGADEYLYSITEVELYVSLIDILTKEFLPMEEKFSSEGMKTLCAVARELSSSDGYREINERLRELSERSREIASVTIGLNLDRRLFPESAGLISVNTEKFSSGQKIEKLVRLDFKNDEHTFISPLASKRGFFSSSDDEALRESVMRSLDAVFKSSLKAWRQIVRTYVLEKTDFLLSLLPEIEFLTAASDFIWQLTERGVKLTYPVLHKEGKILSARGLVNPVTALATASEMVPNDITFDENGTIYVLTGPNRGGKSVFTTSLGDAVIMAQLGLPVAAEYFELSVCDNVFCHFPDGDDTIERGRLGSECERLQNIVKAVSADSLVLLDESLSSTGSEEASAIAEEFLAGLAAIGCRAVFSTHLHTLARSISEINERSAAYGGVRTDTLVAAISGSERSFRIERRSPEGKSYAADVASRYGLSLSEILDAARGKEKRDE